jgi:hypothetical protein
MQPRAASFAPPQWIEIKMDAEIGSYQEDAETPRDPVVDADPEAGENAR